MNIKVDKSMNGEIFELLVNNFDKKKIKGFNKVDISYKEGHYVDFKNYLKATKTLYILTYASPTSDKYGTYTNRYIDPTTKKTYTIKDGQRYKIEPTPSSIPKFFKQFTWGCAYKNIIYVYFNIFNYYGKSNCIDIIESMLNEVKSIIKPFTSKDREELKKLFLKEEKLLFINLVTKGHHKKINNLETELSDHNTNIESYQKEVIRRMKLLGVTQTQIDALKSNEKEVSKKAKTLLNDLEKIDKIDKIEVKNANILTFYTKTMYLTHRKKKTKLGRYRIEVNTDNGNLRFFNEDIASDSKYTFPHPHINSTAACFGNLKKDIASYVGSYQYDVLITVLLEYLETSYNSSDCYIKLADFKKYVKFKGDKTKRTARTRQTVNLSEDTEYELTSLLGTESQRAEARRPWRI